MKLGVSEPCRYIGVDVPLALVELLGKILKGGAASAQNLQGLGAFFVGAFAIRNSGEKLTLVVREWLGVAGLHDGFKAVEEVGEEIEFLDFVHGIVGLLQPRRAQPCRLRSIDQKFEPSSRTVQS